MSNVFDFIADIFDGLSGRQKKNSSLSDLFNESPKTGHRPGWHPNVIDHDGGSVDTAISGSGYDKQQQKLAKSKREGLFSSRLKF